MTHFNLNHLRADAECYAPAHHRDDHAIIIDFLIEALIGSDHYDLMLQHPNAMIVFKQITASFKGFYCSFDAKDGQYLCMYHGLTK